MKMFKVAVFARQREPNLKLFCRAYLLWYHPSWSGFNEVIVAAENGKEAKKEAIKILRQRFLENPDSVNLE